MQQGLTPTEFISKWKGSQLTERQAYQAHFIDLCRLLDEPAPYDPGTDRDNYCFEKGTVKLEKGRGWADVWKRGHFAWEYKGPGKSLDKAYGQLQQYAVALENPPLLIASDFQHFKIHTNWTNTVQKTHEIPLEELRNGEQRRLLKWAFAEPERLRPSETREALTERAARNFVALAQRLRDRGHPSQQVAHFVNRLIFCMFAEDVGLLKNDMFSLMLDKSVAQPRDFPQMARLLFGAMRDGGYVGFERVEWFNGGLFDNDEVIPLEPADLAQVREAARLDWSDIDPSILGTLFERGLDPDKRSQLGAHYTDREKIKLIVQPVIVEPLNQEWAEVKEQIAAKLDKAEKAKAQGAKTKARNEAARLHATFLERLRNVRVLDPACGSGNFLYVSLLALKDLEHKVNLEADEMGLERPFPAVGPECIRGIEINPYAAELARVSVWIGEIQWMLRNGFSPGQAPVLRPLQTIECRDALLNADGIEAAWPDADFIVGNPPFLGGSKILGGLGEDYAAVLRTAYKGRVPGGADLVTYWFAKAADQIAVGRASRAGLVATNSIRGGSNRDVLDRICESGTIFNAWSDEPWVVDGAAVRVSLVCFTMGKAGSVLNGNRVRAIYADLTGAAGGVDTLIGHNNPPEVFHGRSVDLTLAGVLSQNIGICFMGASKKGPFDVQGQYARRWLEQPANPNGQKNNNVLSPLWNAIDVVRRPRDMWCVDFGCDMPLDEASVYEMPFAYIEQAAKEMRQDTRDAVVQQNWWRFGRPRIEMRQAIRPLSRCVATPALSKHRVFVWMDTRVLPDQALLVFARDDDTTFGVLHSRFHELWSLRLGTSLEDRPRYTPSTTFETFPFPEGLTPDIAASDYQNDPRAAAISYAARKLNDYREKWLNPPELVMRVPEVAPSFPDRVVPINDTAAAKLKSRTLTNLYNERPAWLDNLHRELDEAVADAYGWPADLPDDDVLARLLEINQTRVAA